MEEIVPWSAKYSLGIKDIDEQHQHLFELANRVFKLSDDNEKEDIKELLVEFSEYMKTHFKDEEEYMRSIKFPELEYHQKLHENIIDTLSNVVKEVSSISELKIKMKDIAKKVLIEHIVDSDMKIKEYQEESANISTYIDDIEMKVKTYKLNRVYRKKGDTHV